MCAVNGLTHQAKSTVVLWLVHEAVQTTPLVPVAALLLPTAVISLYSRPETNTVLFWHAATVVCQSVPSNVVLAGVLLSTAKVMTPPAVASPHC